MAIAFVRQKIADAWTSGATLTISGMTAIANGNVGIVQYNGAAGASGVTSISYTGGTGANIVQCVTNRRSEIWYIHTVSGGGTSITLNLNFTPAAAGLLSASYIEVSGLDTSSIVDATGFTSNNGTSSTTPTTGSITPTASGREAIVFATTRMGGVYSSGPDSGFTRLTASDTRGESGYLITTLSGSYNVGWVCASGTFGASIATLLAPAASGGSVPLFDHHYRMRRSA